MQLKFGHRGETYGERKANLEITLRPHSSVYCFVHVSARSG
jgi:hypothetical protein